MDDDFDISKIPSNSDLDKSNPIGGGKSGKNDASVSHSPLNLGGGSNNTPAPAAKPKPKIQMPAQSKIGAAAKNSGQEIVSTERITGMRTFYTKLHAGAIDFLGEVIANWLRDNPGISIKRTNVVTGEIQGKKTEPNIIITVWY
jgi:hypothetical protein